VHQSFVPTLRSDQPNCRRLVGTSQERREGAVVPSRVAIAKALGIGRASAGPGNEGFYLMFMGKQESFAAFMAWVIGALAMPAIGPAMMASSIMGNAHAITVFPAASIGLGASVGVTASAWAGRIF